MDFVVLVTCNECGCSFELNDVCPSRSRPIACPNCFQEVLIADCKSLRKAIQNRINVPSKLDGIMRSDCTTPRGFKLEVRDQYYLAK